jgi:hypothetical protein
LEDGRVVGGAVVDVGAAAFAGGAGGAEVDLAAVEAGVGVAVRFGVGAAVVAELGGGFPVLDHEDDAEDDGGDGDE